MRQLSSREPARPAGVGEDGDGGGQDEAGGGEEGGRAGVEDQPARPAAPPAANHFTVRTPRIRCPAAIYYPPPPLFSLRWTQPN